MTNNNLGLYIHIPFCKKKCNYCDFYSVVPTDSIKKRYIESLCTEIKKWGERTARPIDTMYIGGGTPSLLSHNELALIFGAVRSSFTLLDGAEITVEINPGDNIADFLKGAVALGVNRVSIGVQSCNENELCVLGRRHNTEDAVCAVKAARNAGIKNISADIMVEEGTPFDKMNISVPNDDKTAEQYMQLCNAMRKAGYEHYEISNFAKKGYQSRHNNRYWLQEEYIGIGPSAHSFFDGKRFFYERDINAFIDGAETVFDGFGGDQAEYIMLRLRLNTGLNFKEFEAKFNKSLDARIIDKAKSLEKHGLCRVNDSISLTDKGMLVSNTIISTLLGVIYEDI